MSDIDIQIAQALGWKVVKTNLVFRLLKPSGEFVRWERTEDEAWSHIPAYSSSLDLMHELEMMIPEDKRDDYIVSLSAQLRKHSGVMAHEWTRVTATAEQRAQAWLKVMG